MYILEKFKALTEFFIQTVRKRALDIQVMLVGLLGSISFLRMLDKNPAKTSYILMGLNELIVKKLHLSGSSYLGFSV